MVSGSKAGRNVTTIANFVRYAHILVNSTLTNSHHTTGYRPICVGVICVYILKCITNLGFFLLFRTCKIFLPGKKTMI